MPSITAQQPVTNSSRLALSSEQSIGAKHATPAPKGKASAFFSSSRELLLALGRRTAGDRGTGSDGYCGSNSVMQGLKLSKSADDRPRLDAPTISELLGLVKHPEPDQARQQIAAKVRSGRALHRYVEDTYDSRRITCPAEHLPDVSSLLEKVEAIASRTALPISEGNKVAEKHMHPA